MESTQPPVEEKKAAVKTAFQDAGALEENGLVRAAVLEQVLQELGICLTDAEKLKVLELGGLQEGLLDLGMWVDKIFAKKGVKTSGYLTDASESKAPDGAAADFKSQLPRLPSPARRRPRGNAVSAQASPRQPSSASCPGHIEPCPIVTCPWYDGLAFFLQVRDVEQLVCSCTGLRSELSIKSKVNGEQKLLVPVAELNSETAERTLNRISVPHVRIFRFWQRRAFDLIADIVAHDGPQQLLSLERLAFKGCPLFFDDFQRVLLPACSRVGGLRHLNLEKNQVTDDVIEQFVNSGAFAAACPESMNLRFNRITAKGAAALASCDAGFSRMRWINMKMNQIGDEGALAFADLLKRNSSMTMLNLRRQTPPLTDKAAIGLAEALQQNSTLEQLRVRRNRIGNAGAAALAVMLQERLSQPCSLIPGERLRFELDLEENRIATDGALSLLRALQTASPSQGPKPQMVEVLLHGNSTDREAFSQAAAEAGGLDAGDSRVFFTSKAEALM